MYRGRQNAHREQFLPVAHHFTLQYLQPDLMTTCTVSPCPYSLGGHSNALHPLSQLQLATIDHTQPPRPVQLIDIAVF